MQVTELGRLFDAAGLSALSFATPPLQQRLVSPRLRAAAGLGAMQWRHTEPEAGHRKLSVVEEAALVESMIGRITKHQVIGVACTHFFPAPLPRSRVRFAAYRPMRT